MARNDTDKSMRWLDRLAFPSPCRYSPRSASVSRSSLGHLPTPHHLITLSSRYALSLGVNLLGHNGNSQDGRMKVLIWLCSRSVRFMSGSPSVPSVFPGHSPPERRGNGKGKGNGEPLFHSSCRSLASHSIPYPSRSVRHVKGEGKGKPNRT